MKFAEMYLKDWMIMNIITLSGSTRQRVITRCGYSEICTYKYAASNRTTNYFPFLIIL